MCIWTNSVYCFIENCNYIFRDAINLEQSKSTCMYVNKYLKFQVLFKNTCTSTSPLLFKKKYSGPITSTLENGCPQEQLSHHEPPIDQAAGDEPDAHTPGGDAILANQGLPHYDKDHITQFVRRLASSRGSRALKVSCEK